MIPEGSFVLGIPSALTAERGNWRLVTAFAITRRRKRATGQGPATHGGSSLMGTGMNRPVDCFETSPSP